MRLDKFLVDAGVGSRSQVKELLKKKKITVNGKVITSAKEQIKEKEDHVVYKDQTIMYEDFLYYMLNKPAGVISATEDKEHQTVVDLLDQRAVPKKVFPVGRLDKDTHGLLLLTNNGGLAHELLSPKKHVDKVYIAKVSGIMTSKDQEAFANGIELSDHHCLPAKLEILSSNSDQHVSEVKITIKEGKFHQIKRMVKACGKEVTDLQRLSMGPVTLDPKLALGHFRRLTEDEVAALCQNQAKN
ncbi:16S rRNA pseudouridine(516) synthase [Streptococcus iniae]|uniref:pseudouridine synthase n=1 Tax=Streptococcus iniae TaxID=1346 RepID=UPI000EF6A7FF|nr:pseudouridine synthase [Streptococcus iniae]RLU61862.1 16S rRNA pseudouridine(516) synthase [Streptococcus iniae]RLU63388.1 16S rRNA pseudouridine(516) synthase [Streptococcus iniae]RLU71741.1 16S rRNA pseudouridine(516) synthase [Streptococcus iniae]RLU85553.1 16S rRNA pseudouridine(516) synthase [Streptococcus iniae]RLU85683.1 16S rRNA pseudouridine(516) synthase [Streptococcus iniae]